MYNSIRVVVLVMAVALIGYGVFGPEEKVVKTTPTSIVTYPEDSPPTPDVQVADLNIETKVFTSRMIAEVYDLPLKRAAFYGHAIVEAAETYGVPVAHLVSLVATESRFRKAPKGRYHYVVGPAQVDARYWGDLGYDLQDPAENIMAGAHILATYKEALGSWSSAMKAYNVGITNYRNGKLLPAQARYINKINYNLTIVSI